MKTCFEVLQKKIIWKFEHSRWFVEGVLDFCRFFSDSLKASANTRLRLLDITHGKTKQIHTGYQSSNRSKAFVRQPAVVPQCDTSCTRKVLFCWVYRWRSRFEDSVILLRVDNLCSSNDSAD